ncbi:hypothetical protein V5F32_01020 [Xanthobacter oligotrophicus]|uniref:Uncharacterized protein n=1 Tax=Xanthobacter oligotrophicus TaxID=2607286 RepID=A0ABW6ZPT6_9HYPH
MKWLLWRWRAARYMRKTVPDLSFLEAWDYCGEHREYYFAEGYSPQNAVNEDCYYWD